MRPVNLIPAEERRGDSAPTRTGPLAYLIVGALFVVLVGVCALVLLGNSAADKRAEVASLERQATEAQAHAAALSPYVDFASLRDARVQTIDSLAMSRFDWERVVRELSRLIPRGVWLSNLTGTVSPEVQLDDGAGVSLRSSIPGPAIELVGCARSQADIARMIAAVNDVDGVTRVTAVNGTKPSTPKDTSTGASGGDSAASADTSGICPNSAPAFQLVAAFDAITVADTSAAPAPATPTPAPAASPATSQDTSARGAGQGPGSTEAKDVAGANSKSQQATNLIPGG